MPINYPLDEWMLTEKYKNAKDGFFMMALLHGSSFWSKAPVNYRNKLYRIFDSIKMNEERRMFSKRFYTFLIIY